jgi:hypothetical protein
MSDAGMAAGKVIVHRTMSLDGFIAGPGDSMDWIFEYATPDQAAEVMAATEPLGITHSSSVTTMRFRVRK